MKRFTIYPKKGESFSLTFKRFSVEDGRFVLYDSVNEASDNGFLSFENVAAICVADQERPKFDDIRSFEIRLKERPEPLNVFAHCFKIDSSKGVEFYLWNIRGRDVKLDDIYIAASEVVSIAPVSGLTKYVD
jgi:hypothetical protein